MDKLQTALHFLRQGIAVIPLRHRGKEPESSLMNGSWERYKTALPTEYQVTNWLFSTWQNYGVIAGWKGLSILDFDNADAFDIWYSYFTQYLLRVYEATPYIVKTSRGAHVYLSMPAGGSNEKRRGVDVKFHGYVVGPGSIHPNGTQYVPITDFRLVDVFSLDIILPVDLFQKIAPSASTCQIETFCDKLSPVDGLSPQGDLLAIASGTSYGFDLISKVKSAIRIESLFSNVQRTSIDGRWLSTICPFHDDHNPSMWIDTRRQLCGCQVCGMKPMDAINLYARMHNISESVAVSQMAREVGVWG